MSVDTKYARGFALSDETDAAAEEVILGLADEVDLLREDYAKIVHANAEVGSLNVGLQLEVDRLWKPLLAAAKSIRDGSGEWETFYDAVAACEEKP